MRVTKSLLEFLITACINDYGGEYGKVKKIFDNTERFDVENVEGYFGYLISEPHTLYIVFRGTDEGFDWKQNFKFRKLPVVKMTNGIDEMHVPYSDINPKIRVHRGFSIDYKKVRKKILEKCKDGTYNTIIVTGHSKGGAEATLAAVDIQYNFPKRKVINVPFASPKVGNKYFVESYNKRVPKTLRVVNAEDYITKVPLGIQGYKHVGTLLRIGKRNPICWIPVIRAFGSFYHYPSKGYLKNIKKLPEDYSF